MTTPRFVSEPIEPLPGPREMEAMTRGEPGLPAGFRWRGEEHRIIEVLERAKTTSPSMGESYVRRHTFRLRMEDGATWVIYCLRLPPHGWFLKTVLPPP